MAKKKTAVVVIHGIGEQRPMNTISGFVQAAWVSDTNLVHPSRAEVFSKPELVTGSFELRRITTRAASSGKRKRVDFLEYYWAHHMKGPTIGDLLAWMSGLFIRSPSSVPRSVMGVWMLGILLLSLAAVIALAWGATFFGFVSPLPNWLAAALSPLLAVAGFILNNRILPYAGDAARYLSAAPKNVAIRQKIRQEGVSLIEKLTASGDYDRIVLVGHSLGSVIAYDIINFAWNRLDQSKMTAIHTEDSDALAALSTVEINGLALKTEKAEHKSDAILSYRDAQRVYQGTLIEDPDQPFWIISDLVTLGSPLSKADVLLADDKVDFLIRQRKRELPTCPPVFETSPDGAAHQFSYPFGQNTRRPHHSAPFASVVWTNIYVPHRLILFGDVISGPLHKLFGQGVKDIELKIGNPPGFRHTQYWALKKGLPTPAITALRCALNLAEHKKDVLVWKPWNDEMSAGSVTLERGS